jgi:hypothetical protein
MVTGEVNAPAPHRCAGQPAKEKPSTVEVILDRPVPEQHHGVIITL